MDKWWHDYREDPEPNEELICILQGCETGNLQQAELIFKEDEGFRLKDSKISNAWDVLVWRYKSPNITEGGKS